jgi:uncharacterized repeat protein (TIGR03803 family)
LIYEFDPESNSLVTKVNFTGANGAYPKGSLTLSSNGNFYGMTWMGGSKGQGTVFEYDPETSSLLTKIDFDKSKFWGAYPLGGLHQSSNGKMYGMTYGGGNHDLGTLFEFDPATGAFAVKVHFSGVNGSRPHADVVESENKRLYGMTWAGGVSNKGVLFEFDPQSGSFTTRLDFDYPTGYGPMGSLTFATVNSQQPVHRVNLLAEVKDEPATEIVITGVQSDISTKERDINLFPNPANEKLYLDLTDLWASSVEIVVINVVGKKIYSRSDVGGQIVAIDIGNIQKGVYLIRASQLDRIFVKKFIKD